MTMMDTANEKRGKKKRLSNAQIFHFFEQLRVLISAGITPYAALQIMRHDADNQDTGSVIDELGGYIAEGRLLSESLTATGRFPGYVGEFMNIGEQTGKLEDVCGALAR